MCLNIGTFRLFWDLYSAAPERRDQCEPSQEAKAFHEYVNNFVVWVVDGFFVKIFILVKGRFSY